MLCISSKLNITFRDEVRGHHHGQTDCTLFAMLNGNPVGYVEYSIYQKTIHVDHIFVHPDMRRQGIATDLMEYLKQTGMPIDWGMTTPEGTALRNSLES